MRKYLPGPFYCELCGNEVGIKDLRIESTHGADRSGKPICGHVNFCHNKCSEGFNGSKKIRSDLMGMLLDYPDEVFRTLTEEYERFQDPHFLSIRRKLFGE